MRRLLPTGSVVLLKDSIKRIMIIGYGQEEVSEKREMWDYAGCLYPEGYMGGDKVFLFNHEQIQSIYYIGYQDAAQMEFGEKVSRLVEEKKAQRGEKEHA